MEHEQTAPTVSMDISDEDVYDAASDGEELGFAEDEERSEDDPNESSVGSFIDDSVVDLGPMALLRLNNKRERDAEEQVSAAKKARVEVESPNASPILSPRVGEGVGEEVQVVQPGEEVRVADEQVEDGVFFPDTSWPSIDYRYVCNDCYLPVAYGRGSAAVHICVPVGRYVTVGDVWDHRERLFDDLRVMREESIRRFNIAGNPLPRGFDVNK